MKRVLRVMAVVFLMTAFSIVGCQTLPPSADNESGSSSESGSSANEPENPWADEIFAYYGRMDNPLPSYADADADAPFADLKDSDIVSVEALCPLVASGELTAEERQAFTETLRAMTVDVEEKTEYSIISDSGYPTYGGSLHGGALWFDVGFADGSTWLMHLKLTSNTLTYYDPGASVLYAGGREYWVHGGTYDALDELFSACGQRVMGTLPSKVKPFADLTREDVVSADFYYSGCWEPIADEKIDELVQVLRDITVNPTTANNWLSSDLYGGSPEKIRIVCSDGSSHIVGTWAGVFIDGFVYQGTVEELNYFWPD